MPNQNPYLGLRRQLVRLLCSPWTILFCAALGVFSGIVFPEFSQKLALGGEVYLNYITLLTIPLIICALSSSLASLIQHHQRGKHNISLKKMFLLLLCLFFFFGAAGIISEMAVNHFFPDQINVERLDELLHAKEKSQADYSFRMFEAPKENVQKQFSLREFILASLPTNIFHSLSQGVALHILIFSVLFGFALGMIPAEQSQNVICLLSSTYQACLYLIQCSIYVLPFCIFCLLANMISLLDYTALKLVSKFMLVIFCLQIFLIVLGLLLWSRTLRLPLRELLTSMGRTMLIAISSSQSFVAMPMMMQDMEKKLLYSPEQVKLVVPFAFTMGKHSRILLLTITTAFISYLYYGTLPLSTIFVLLIVSPLLSIGGAWPIVVSSMLKILGLPGELGLLLLLTINPFIDPLSTLCNVIYDALLSSLIMKRPDSADGNPQTENAANPQN